VVCLFFVTECAIDDGYFVLDGRYIMADEVDLPQSITLQSGDLSNDEMHRLLQKQTFRPNIVNHVFIERVNNEYVGVCSQLKRLLLCLDFHE